MIANELERRAGDFRQHPRFERAVAVHTEGILRLRSRLSDASKILAKEERYRAFTIFAMLAAEGRLAGDERIGHREFYEILTKQASVSDRTARTVAGLLVHFRFAAVRADPQDGRRRILKPSERTFSYCLDWSRPVHAALAILDRPEPEGDRDAMSLATFREARPAYCAASLSFFDMDEDFSRIFSFLEGGSVVSMAALDAAFAGRQAPTRSEVAERFGLSRAQVSRVVAEGREVGLFTPAATATASPRLVSLFLDCEARVFAFVDLFRELAERRQRPAAPQPCVEAYAEC